ncbi:MAG: ABC transporter ATP-binding protein/permease [Actinomycetota bacterium]|nr:ABC transporter ATP-binding protein/permease [Actinomycetota bacterium]MDQ3642768.1 ABC transporter ATP-binding protein/permease [Actinomycetota bacterium]
MREGDTVAAPGSGNAKPGGDGRGGAESGGRPGGRLDHSHVFLPRVQRLRKLPLLVVKALRLVWRAGRRELIVTTLLQLFQGVGVTAQLLLGKSVLDSVLATTGSVGGFSAVAPQFGILMAITVLLSFANAVQAEQSRVLGELVARAAYNRVLDVAGTVDLEAFESPAFFDRLQRAQIGGLTRPLQMVNGLGTLTTSVVTLLGIAVALVALQPVLLPFILLGYAPLWYASTRNSKALYQFVLGMTEDDRQRAYLQRILSGRDEAKEVRAFALGPLLRARYERLYAERIAKLRQVARKRMIRSLSAALGTSGLTVASLGVLGYLYVDGQMSLPSLGAAVAGLLQLSGRLRGLADGAGALYESALFVDDYESFLEVIPQLPAAHPVEDPLPPFEHLATVGLTFTYPGAGKPAVEDVSMEIRAGEIVALVGENGSGKTTLAKLLAHLYRPSKGSILWDGVDTASFDPLRVRCSISVIFQDFVRYLLPARENIGAGRHERFDDAPAIVAAARWAGADAFISRLPKGYETTLGKEFTGGSDLSLGQWQRVALARAFFRDAPFVVLDEPTAALDPRAEDELLNSIRSLFQGRSVLLISHRFSSVRWADRICVLRGGRLVEQGSHGELMAKGGIYAELFTLQASAYLSHHEERAAVPPPAG